MRTADPTATSSPPRPPPPREVEGAVALVGVFMALFLVGLMYYSIGVGRAVLAREQMQDAADAAAFSAAVVYARGMNLVVLLNVMISVAYGITVVTQVVLALAREVQQNPARYGDISPQAQADLGQLERQASEAFSRVYDPLRAGARAAHDAALVLRDEIGRAAATHAVDVVRFERDPPAVFVQPRARPLPVQGVPDGQVCEEISQVANYVGFRPFQRIGLGDAEREVSEQFAQRTSAATVCPLPDEATQPLALRPDVRLGDEAFSVRGFVIARVDMRLENQGVTAANRWQGLSSATSPSTERLRAMTELAIAQAEFVYAGNGATPELWLWEPEWRARMRRVTLQQPGVTLADIRRACVETPEADHCDRLAGLDLPLLHHVIVH